MKPDVVLHIVAGSVSIVAGFVALYAGKGAPLHRRAGRAFVVTMLVMATTGGLLALLRDAAPALNVPAAVLAAYLVVTARAAVRPPGAAPRAGDRVALGVALALAAVCLGSSAKAVAGGRPLISMPAMPLTMFGLVALMGAVGDVRLLRAGGVRGVARVRRHLWRMTFALFIATASFFLGQADEIPKAIRIPALLATPVLAVLATLVYWLVRYRPRRGRAAYRATGAAVEG